MKKLSILFALLLLFSSMVLAEKPQEISDVFQFDKSKMDIGNMYHYVVSDINDKNPIDFYIYVKSVDSIVIYKGFDKLVPGSVYIINATFDWKHMMRSKIDAYNPIEERLPNVEIGTKVNVDFGKNKVYIEYTKNNNSGESKTQHSVYSFKKEPCYDYGLFHFDLQFAFRFIKEDIHALKILTSYSVMAAEADVKYIGDETVDKIECKKYEIKTKGIIAAAFNAKANIWIAKNDVRQYTVKYINYVQRDTFWKNLKIQLKGIKSMNLDEWESFTKELISKANLGK